MSEVTRMPQPLPDCMPPTSVLQFSVQEKTLGPTQSPAEVSGALSGHLRLPE